MNARFSTIGTFPSASSAQQAVRELRQASFTEDQIGVISRGGVDAEGSELEHGSEWEEGAVAGGLTGAAVGGAWALAIAAGALPAIGPVIAGGILGSVLASAAGGAAVGGVAGALIGMGVPEEEAQAYQSEFEAGRTLVTVETDIRRNEAEEILRRNGALVRDSVPVGSGALSASEDRTSRPLNRPR